MSRNGGYYMKKRELLKKSIAGVLMAALALTGSITPLPKTANAASYFVSPWRAEGTVSVHDPSIITTEDAEGKTVYYIFGSHLAFAKSYDLKKWETLKNNICTDYENLFKVGAEWAKIGEAGYSLVPPDAASNIWAPDVIWNEDMKKWCMYMTINGNSWNSTICLLTADSLDGDWKYIDTVIYSGFTDKEYGHDYTLTDYQKVTGETTLADRYKKAPYSARGNETTTWSDTYGAHAIDPCVRYDEEGKLWMSYGSWSGGIYMIELDKKTGLRDLTHKYETVANQSDAYMGIQIAGGNGVSGEAPYIRKIGDYYYLFVSYGGLTATGGYNVRVFRSKNITGPYEDSRGTSAIFSSNTGSNTQGKVGNRLMAYYQWSWSNFGEIAQGHNSAFVDKDGKAYIIYHTRSTNYGEEHKVRTHQLFQNENGWLVEAPFAYNDETISPEGYSTEEIAGTYEIIFHEATILGEKEPNTGTDITLHTDGTVTCATNKNLNGTWRETEGSYYMEIKLGSTVFHGVFTTGTVEGTSDKTLCFTALGDQSEDTDYQGIYVWGVRLSDDLTNYIESNLELKTSKVSIVKGSTQKIKILSTASDTVFLKKAVWKSSKPAVATVNSNGKVTAKKAGKATITATVNGKSLTCAVTVTKKTAKKATKK